MNSNENFSDSINDTLNELEELKQKAEKLQREELSLTTEFSSNLLRLEKSLLECMNCGWEIDSILEDDEISPFEFEKLVENISNLSFITDELSKNHPENAKTINEVVDIYMVLHQIISKIKYVSEITSGYQGSKHYHKERGYTVFETKLHEAINFLSYLLLDHDKKTSKREISKIERELINTARVVGLIFDRVALNSVYLEPTGLMTEVLNAADVLKTTIEPIHSLVKERYYLEEIQKAQETVDKLSKEEGLKFGDTLEIKGLFNRIKMVGALEEISEIFRVRL